MKLRQVRARCRFREPPWGRFSFRISWFDRDQTALISDLLLRFH